MKTPFGPGKYFALSLNAEPWAVGTLGIKHKGKHPYPYMSPNQKLQAYQEAVREALAGAELTEGQVEITLYIWRRLDKARVYGGRDRKAQTSDATNIQKATEDAIQGILIENDRNVRRITTEIVEQNDTCEPGIVIYVQPYVPSPIEGSDLMNMLPKKGGWYDPDSDPMADVQDLFDSQRRIEDVF
jgi:Holliday junction resolvase RusA-like endonuclease